MTLTPELWMVMLCIWFLRGASWASSNCACYSLNMWLIESESPSTEMNLSIFLINIVTN